ncbi:MAG: hypothetical protein GF364_13290 [Candidatus Lokiarchaeota archaeon]|nr:hypothetical protein [Candidatus Lokiarchaeota archaeon]
MSDMKVFVFRGTDTTGETGDWDVVLDAQGHMSITQFKDEAVPFSGMLSLEDKTEQVWDLIETIKFENLNFPDREPNDNESEILLDYTSKEREVSRLILADNLHDNENVMNLLLKFQELIAIASGKKPVF